MSIFFLKNLIDIKFVATIYPKKKFENKNKIAQEVGKTIAEKAVKKGISLVKFDRGGYLYHGRVKSLADGAREGGLKF